MTNQNSVPEVNNVAKYITNVAYVYCKLIPMISPWTGSDIVSYIMLLRGRGMLVESLLLNKGKSEDKVCGHHYQCYVMLNNVFWL